MVRRLLPYLFGICFAMLLGAGCATSGEKWSHATKRTLGELNKDKEDCKQAIIKRVCGVERGCNAELAYAGRLDECMQKQGWTKLQ